MTLTEGGREILLPEKSLDCRIHLGYTFLSQLLIVLKKYSRSQEYTCARPKGVQYITQSSQASNQYSANDRYRGYVSFQDSSDGAFRSPEARYLHSGAYQLPSHRFGIDTTALKPCYREEDTRTDL